MNSYRDQYHIKIYRIFCRTWLHRYFFLRNQNICILDFLLMICRSLHRTWLQLYSFVRRKCKRVPDFHQSVCHNMCRIGCHLNFHVRNQCNILFFLLINHILNPYALHHYFFISWIFKKIHQNQKEDKFIITAPLLK